MAKAKKPVAAQFMYVYVVSCPEGILELAPDLESAYKVIADANGASLRELDAVESGDAWFKEYLFPDGHPKAGRVSLRIQRFPLKVPGISLYAVRNSTGQFFRRKGYQGSGNTWVDSFNAARIYPKIGAAKSVITFFSNPDNNKEYGKYPVPDLVEMVIGTINVIDQTKRIAKAKVSRELRQAEYEAESLQRQAAEASERAKAAKARLTQKQAAAAKS